MDQPTQLLTAHRAQMSQLREAITGCTTLGPGWIEVLTGLTDAAEAAGPAAPDEPQVASERYKDLREVFKSIEIPVDGQDRMYIKLLPFDVSIKREAEGMLVEIYEAGEAAPLGAMASAYAFDIDTGPDEAEE